MSGPPSLSRVRRVFVYEHLTGGGLLDGPPPSDSLLREGLAMVRALTADLRRVPGLRVLTQWDARLPGRRLPGATLVRTPREAQSCFVELVRAADWTILIAPELDGTLLDLAGRTNRLGGRLLGPGLRWLALASDKHRTARQLAAAGVPAPRGTALGRAERLPAQVAFPCVLKPCDGAGSTDVRCCANRTELAAHWREFAPRHAAWRLEEFCAGRPVSVACLCGPQGFFPLPAFAQRLSRDGRFAYRGGAGPLLARLNERAQRLAVQALAALGPTLGYIGVDLVLGAARDGSADRVIEINPRLTTSYVGLRALCGANLAGALLAVAAGDVPRWRWRSMRIRFTASGAVQRCVR